MKRTLLALSAVFAAGLALPGETQAQTRSPPGRQVVVELITMPGRPVPASIIYNDGSGPRSFVPSDGIVRFSAPILPGGARANLVIRDAANDNYNDTVVIEPARAPPGGQVEIRLDRTLPSACTDAAFKKLLGGAPDVDQLVARYLAAREIRYKNRCLIEKFQADLAATWYRLSLRLHRESPVFPIDTYAEREVLRLAPLRYKTIRQEELA